jgi:hypothetical protein
MTIEISKRILTSRHAAPASVPNDDGGVVVFGEDDANVNPFIDLEADEWNSAIDDFSDEKEWLHILNDADARFKCFLTPPRNMSRPTWLEEFMLSGRQKRNEMKKKSNWRKGQQLLKFFVSRFFELSNAPHTPQVVFRACVVLGFYLISHPKSKSMTNLVLHLVRTSCPPTMSTEPVGSSRRMESSRSARVSRPLRPSRLARLSGARSQRSRPATRADTRKVIKNQETLYLMLITIHEQQLKGSRTTRGGKEQTTEFPEIQHISETDDSSSEEDEGQIESDIEEESEQDDENEVQESEEAHDERSQGEDDDENGQVSEGGEEDRDSRKRPRDEDDDAPLIRKRKQLP